MTGWMQRPWFKPRRYGIGVTPSTPEGWAATAACVILLILDAWLLPRLIPEPRLGRALAMVILVTILGGFVWLAHAKTDGEWRWRWGEDDP